MKWWQIASRDVFPNATIYHDIVMWMIFVAVILLVIAWIYYVFSFNWRCEE